jgi:hypothetical protein
MTLVLTVPTKIAVMRVVTARRAPHASSKVRRDQIPLYLINEHKTKFMFRGEAARADEIASAFVDDGLRGGQFLWDENNMNNRDVEVR